MPPRISIILPVHNGDKWLDECLESIYSQTYEGPMQLCVHNDASSDLSVTIVKRWADKLNRRKVGRVTLTLTESKEETPKGCGYAKNRAVESSSGEFLCFLDADDVMEPNRIGLQMTAALESSEDTLIGAKVRREPEGSTVRYTRWINGISQDQLYLQIYTSNGPTVVMPTWFCHRSVFNKVGGFDEGGRGVPEDYLFFLEHLKLGGKLLRVDEVLLMYRHHPEATTASVSENSIWKIRLEAIQERILKNWDHFTIWNAGKQGRKFYRDLSEENRKKVSAFCDVDTKKITKGVYIYENSSLKVKPRVPIVHFTKAQKPFVICMKLDLTAGEFEKNLNSLNLTEGVPITHGIVICSSPHSLQMQESISSTIFNDLGKHKHETYSLKFKLVFSSDDVRLDRKETEVAIYKAMSALHGQAGVSYDPKLVSFDEDEMVGQVDISAKALVRLWSALTLTKSIGEERCAIRVMSVAPLE